MKILVTGGTGFLGSHLCRRLRDQGHDVAVLRRARSNTAALDDLTVRYETGDITDLAALHHAVKGQDAVIHAAADIAYWSPAGRPQTDINVQGSENVARACREQGVKRLVHVSSVSAIGIPPGRDQPADETFPFNLLESGLGYHISKRRAEEAVLREVAQGLDAVIVNPAWIFGPFGRAYRGADMMQKVRRTRIVPYFTGGLCCVHVADVVDGIVGALVQGETGQRYILGGDNVSFKELVQKTAAAMQLMRWFVPVPRLVTAAASAILEPIGRISGRRPPITHATHYCSSRFSFYDSTRARRRLGYRPRGFNQILEECLRLKAC